MSTNSKTPKAPLTLSRETVVALLVRSDVRTGMKPLKSFPNACESVAWCAPKSGNGACF